MNDVNLNSVDCPPDPSGTFESMRAYGYKFSEAISDIIDNSITAKAQNIWIDMHYNNDDSWVRITDDGTGMDQATLISAMTIGKKPADNERSIDDHGRFGFGLKTASISQVRRLSVKSFSKQKDSCIAVWDLDKVEEHGWKLYLAPLDKDSEQRLGTLKNKTGTIVLWEKPDRLVQDGSKQSKIVFEKLGKDLNHLLGCRYHRFIESGKLKIHYNGTEIDFFNPFKLPTTDLKPLGTSSYGDVNVSAYLLPHESKFKNKPKDLQIAKGFKGMFDHQGIYLYRKDRLMIMGDWLNSGLRKTEASKLLRIKIDIDNTHDQEWRIDVRKCNAIIPNSLLPDIRSLILKSKEDAKKRYTFRSAKVKIKTQQKLEEEFCEIWEKQITRKNISFKINKTHPILESLNNSIMSMAKTQKQGRATKKLLYALITHIENMVPIANAIAEYSESTFVPQEPYENEKLKKDNVKLLKDACEILGFNDAEVNEIIKQTNI